MPKANTNILIFFSRKVPQSERPYAILSCACLLREREIVEYSIKILFYKNASYGIPL
jgi:hypothetical protein